MGGVSNLISVLLFLVITNLSNQNIKGIVAFHQIYEELQSESVESVNHLHRPSFHFQPPKHWINDPNGPVYYKGLYHLFYQYNTKGAVWGNIIWAHSVSKDLVNWEALEPAIHPSKWFDIGGTWSGSITIVPGKGPIILYTGVNQNETQLQNYAIPEDPSDPYLRKWIKPDDNPIAMPDYTMNGSAFRDPTTAWFSKDGHWRTVVGSKRKRRGIAYIYRSRDFKHWVKAKHPVHSKESTGMWECPDFFPVSLTDFQNGLDLDYVGPNTKHVLKVSLDITRYEYYTLGKYDPKKDRYIPDGNTPDGWEGLRFDYGNFYASKTFFDYKKNRRILWGWANESDTVEDDILKGWAGIQVIPRTVLLDSSKKQLMFWPVEEIESLRGNYVRMNNHDIKMGQRIEVKGITPAQADVEVTFYVGSLEKAETFDPSFKFKPLDLCKIKGSNVRGGVGPFGLITLATPDLEEYTPVFFRVFKDTKTHKPKVLMCSDARPSSLKQDKGPLAKDRMYKPSFAGFVDVDMADGRISLRSLIDHSVVESFGALGKTVITSRVYPVKAVKENAHLYVFNNGTQTVTIESLNAWNMERPLQMNDGAL
ncbi:ATCWINV4 [Arabidopsis lyrata subsp. lyrata]|uniref:ATCWINV4 n=1 Tax=Arabidopsis lyrata subsp. lyrata TaxID=81972 RepID=D7LIP4_ARALL|nr:beta-fructofuranosidase, insoluble isoenzyme CWINV4 [Arabidopsis lyrata subsp. lyrata]EFH57688.1 ATCWINV4 [Arabidopsis lyrata subsp. lyrata]|eukprot:XP_002881429.1 beta-fructofuranosidase, insoluble isoenzyme CWINV4 [Arabidopsis lyrata subsp. lyrata]